MWQHKRDLHFSEAQSQEADWQSECKSIGSVTDCKLVKELFRFYVRNPHENGTPKTMQADVPLFCMVDGCGCRLPGESFRSEIEQ